jgi:hypothetical protein
MYCQWAAHARSRGIRHEFGRPRSEVVAASGQGCVTFACPEMGVTATQLAKTPCTIAGDIFGFTWSIPATDHLLTAALPLGAPNALPTYHRPCVASRPVSSNDMDGAEIRALCHEPEAQALNPQVQQWILGQSSQGLAASSCRARGPFLRPRSHWRRAAAPYRGPMLAWTRGR